MIISIISSGSRGDVQPYIALAVGLKGEGHEVRMLAPSDFQALMEQHALDFYDLGGDVQRVARMLQGELERGNMLRIMREMGQAAQEFVAEATERSLDYLSGTDLILAGLGGLNIGLGISEARGIPFLPALLYPFTPTTEFPSVLTATFRGLPGWLNKATFSLAQQMMWQPLRAADNKARREILDLEPLPFSGPFPLLHKRDLPILYGYSKHVIPVPKDWSRDAIVTGYWFLEPSKDWQPPDDLVAFLDAGSPPVYIGFGSMGNLKPEEITKLVLGALEKSGQRGVIYEGWGGLEASDLPETVYLTGSIPHRWLFPRMKAVVHHGGVGTTAAGLSSGVPSIITPYFGDQPFWGCRVEQLGVGPQPISRRRLSRENLARAIEVASTDKMMRSAASELGERIRSENGVARAVDIIGDLI